MRNLKDHLKHSYNICCTDLSAIKFIEKSYGIETTEQETLLYEDNFKVVY